MWRLLCSKPAETLLSLKAVTFIFAVALRPHRGLDVFSSRLCVLLSSSTCFCHCVCFPGYQGRTSKVFSLCLNCSSPRRLLATSPSTSLPKGHLPSQSCLTCPRVLNCKLYALSPSCHSFLWFSFYSPASAIFLQTM